MSAKGGALFYSDARPAVREIIALLRLDKILAEWKGDPAG
jgi:anti-anti-sigma regulatory factor